MQLGCNDSRPLRNLLLDQRVAVDYLKMTLYPGFYEAPGSTLMHYPVLLHGLYLIGAEDVGAASLDGIDWDNVNQKLTAYRSPHVGVHFYSSETDWCETPDDQAVMERIEKNARIWVDRCHVPFLVENAPFYPTRGTYRCTTDPQVIDSICRKTGAGLLLDIAHAQVAAWHRGEEIHEYLSSLPLDLVREIHVVGTAMDEHEGLRDHHLEMQNEDYALLQWVLTQARPNILTLEYGGFGDHYSWRSDEMALERQLHTLRAICDAK